MTVYVEQYAVQATDTSKPILQRDKLIDPAILGLYDFVDGYGHDGGAIGVGKSFANYLRGGAAAVASTVFTYTGQAIEFDGGSSQRIVLPAPFLLPVDSSDLIVCVWMKSPLAGHAAGTTSEFIIGTHASGGTQSYNMSIAADGSGNVNDFYQRWGTTTTVASSGNISNNIGASKAQAICNNGWHQVASRFLISPDTTAHKSLLYLDGALISESAWIGRDVGSVLKTLTEPRLGVQTGGNRTFKGSLRRVWAASVPLGPRTADQIITQDWENNHLRLAA